MIRLKTKELIRKRFKEIPDPLTFAYDVGISMPTARGLLSDTDEDDARGHVTFDVLEKLCLFFNVEPGELLELVPDAKKKRRKS